MKLRLMKGAFAMNEKPLERLNYYNGQRLEASDLKTEQEYHIRTRRWLNKSLYSAGIARGLEVRIITEGPKEDTPYVSVSPGLALDNEGREIILLEETPVEVCSYAGKEGSESTVVGNYLVIEYAEETIAYEKGGCAVRVEGKSASKSTAPMGGPSRIRSTVKFSWVPFVPHPGNNQIVLAQVELKDRCKSVGQIDLGERRYIGAASAATVKQYSLEGERHIDKDNPGRFYFHIRGRQPSSVTLYLRAEQFSTLFYTELGKHEHKINANGLEVIIPQHKHPINPIAGALGTSKNTAGTPTYSDIKATLLGVALPNFAMTPLSPTVPLQTQQSLKNNADMQISFNSLQEHSHEIPNLTENNPPIPSVPINGSNTSESSGVSDARARTGVSANAYTYIDNLQVYIGENISGLLNKTRAILDQLQDAQPSVTWDQLGNGNSNHVLAEKGTGAIRLDFLPDISFAEGHEYLIELRVISGGGRIHYNLYIE